MEAHHPAQPDSVTLRFHRTADSRDVEEIEATAAGLLVRRENGLVTGNWDLNHPNPEGEGYPQPQIAAAIAALRGDRETVSGIFTFLYGDTDQCLCDGHYEIRGLVIGEQLPGHEDDDIIWIEGGGRPLPLSRAAAAALAESLARREGGEYVAAPLAERTPPPRSAVGSFDLLNEYIFLVVTRIASNPQTPPSAREVELFKLLGGTPT